MRRFYRSALETICLSLDLRVPVTIEAGLALLACMRASKIVVYLPRQSKSLRGRAAIRSHLCTMLDAGCFTRPDIAAITWAIQHNCAINSRLAKTSQGVCQISNDLLKKIDLPWLCPVDLKLIDIEVYPVSAPIYVQSRIAAE